MIMMCSLSFHPGKEGEKVNSYWIINTIHIRVFWVGVLVIPSIVLPLPEIVSGCYDSQDDEWYETDSTESQRPPVPVLYMYIHVHVYGITLSCHNIYSTYQAIHCLIAYQIIRTLVYISNRFATPYICLDLHVHTEQ